MNYKTTLSDKVFSIIKLRREKAENDFFVYRQKLKADDNLSELDRKIAKCNRLIGYANADNDIATATKVSAEKNQLVAERQNYLNRTGITVAEKPSYFCKNCNDTGYTEKGYCDCFKSLYKTVCLQDLGVSDKVLKTFKDDTLSENYPIGQLYKKIKSDLNNPKFESFLFTGYCGSGKTFLAECVASEFVSRGSDVLVLTSFELNNLFLTYHTAPVDEKNFYFSALKDSDLLVIDDLGAEPIFNKVTIEYLFLVVSERKKSGKPFIITTNLTLKELLARYGERVFSRLVQEGDTTCIDFGKQNLRTVR